MLFIDPVSLLLLLLVLALLELFIVSLLGLVVPGEVSVLGDVPVLRVVPVFGVPVFMSEFVVPVLGEAVEFGFCVVALLSVPDFVLGVVVAALPGLVVPVPPVCA